MRYTLSLFLLATMHPMIIYAQGDPPLLPSSPRQQVGDPPTLPMATKSVASRSTPGGTEPELVLDTGGCLSEVSDIAFSPDGQFLAVAGDKLVRIYDVQSGVLTKTLRGDRSRSAYGTPMTVAYSPDGNHLLVGIHDDHPRGSIRLYRTDRLDEIEAILPGLRAPCHFIRFSRDGRYMMSSDGNGEICFWDWPTKRIVKRIPNRNPDKPVIDSVGFAMADPFVISIEHDAPHIYRAPDGREMRANDQMPATMLGWIFDVLTDRVAWPHDTKKTDAPRKFDFQLEKNLWAAAGNGIVNRSPKYWVGLWNARSMDRSAPANQPIVVYDRHRWQVRAVAIHPQGNLVASGDKFGEVHLWDAKTGQRRRVIRSQGRSVYDAAFNGDTNQIAFGTAIDYKNWGINSYGTLQKVLDLRQRTIRPIDPGLQTIGEQKSLGNVSISTLRPAAGSQSSQLVKQVAGRTVSKYRLPSGKLPSVYTLLGKPTLGVQQPVLFGDDEGLLAMWDTARDEMQRYYHGHRSMITSISPSASGKVFVTGSTDRTIRVWSLLNHTRTGVFDFKYENSAVIAVRPGTSSARAGVQVGDRIESIDGKTLQQMYELMMLGQFNYKPGQTVPVVLRRGERSLRYNMKLDEGFDYVEPLLNIFVGDRDEWIIWTPKGYYDCSPGADRVIGWHVNQGPDKPAKFFRAEQFKNLLYRPDVINAIIDTGDVDEAIRFATGKYPARGRAADLTDANTMAASVPPSVQIQPTSRNAADPRVTIRATVTTSNSLPITEVTLLHNGTPAKVFKPSNAAEQKEFEISYRCRLFPGRNKISFIASNRTAQSAAEEAEVVMEGVGGDERSKVYVLAIGISQYTNSGKGFDNLKYAADDARAFLSTIESHRDGKLYGEVEAKILVDKEASRAEILGALQWLVDNVNQGDVVMLFAACHGFIEKDNLYLATHEVDKENLRATGISWREITGILHEELPACKRVVFLDACHSAGIAGTDTRNPLHDLSSAELGTIFYASCTFQQQSYESDEWRHGAFTKSLLDLMLDKRSDFAPSTGDGLLSTLEVESGISEKVRVITRGRQQPVVFTPTALSRYNVLELSTQ